MVCLCLFCPISPFHNIFQNVFSKKSFQKFFSEFFPKFFMPSLMMSLMMSGLMMSSGDMSPLYETKTNNITSFEMTFRLEWFSDLPILNPVLQTP